MYLCLNYTSDLPVTANEEKWELAGRDLLDMCYSLDLYQMPVFEQHACSTGKVHISPLRWKSQVTGLDLDTSFFDA